jgi:hypothetical protein
MGRNRIMYGKNKEIKKKKMKETWVRTVYILCQQKALLAGHFYRSGSVGNCREPDEFKFEFKPRSTIGSDQYTDMFDRYTGPVRSVPGRLNTKTELV